MTLDYVAFVKAFRQAVDFEKIISTARRTIQADVCVTPLEACRDLPLGPADPLLDLCDISPELRQKIIPQPAKNQRMDDAVLLALLDANRAYADRDERKAAKQLILTEANKNV